MKKNTWFKRVVALVCVCSLLLGSNNLLSLAETDSVSDNNQTELAEVTLSDMGIIAGKYMGDKTFDVKKTTDTALMNARTTFYLTLDATAGSAIYFASPADYWVGLRLRVTDSGTLALEHTGGSSVMQGIELVPAKVGLQSFMDTKLKLTLELFEDGEDIKLGVYINDTLYDSTYHIVKDDNLGNGFYIALVGNEDSVTLEEELRDLELPEITLSQMGISAGTYSGRGTFAINKTTSQSLMNVKTTMYLTMSASKHSYIDFATYDNWFGLRLRVGDEGSLWFEHTDGNVMLGEELKPEKAGLSSFFGTKYKLSFALYTEGGETRVRLYFNDRVYDNKYYVINDSTQLGDCFNVALAEDTDYIVVEEPLAALNLPEISLSDMGIEAKRYTGEKTFDVKKTTTQTLKNAVTSMHFTWNASVGSAVNFANYDDWNGPRLRVADGGVVYFEHTNGGSVMEGEALEPNKVGLTSFIGTSMKLSLALYEEGGETRVRLYINDLLYDNKYYVIADSAKVGDGFNITLNNNADTVLLEEVRSLEIPEEEPLPPLELPEIGLAHLGISSGTYNGVGTFAVKKTTDQSLMNVITSMKIKWDASMHSAIYYATYDDWYGLRLRVADNGEVWFEHTNGAMGGELLDPTKVGLNSFFGKEFELSIALYEEDNETRVRLYINDILYGNKYYVITDPTLLGDGFNIALQQDTDSLVLSEAIVIPLEPLELPEIGLADMGIAEDTYDGKGTFAVRKTTGKSLMNAITTFYITMSASKHSTISFATYDDWYGLRLRVGDNGAVYFEHTDGNVMQGEELDPTKAGLESFMGVRFKLSVAIYEEDEEIRVRLYFNDVVYDNKYYVVSDPAKLGDGFNIALYDDADYVVLEESKELPPPGEINLPKIGLEHLGITEGSYTGKGTFSVIKSSEQSLMNAMTTMYITLNASKGSTINFASYDSWFGIRFRVGDEGALYFEHTGGAMAGEQLDPTKVGLDSFMGTRFKLTIALYEEDDETRVRLYINDILYDNKYYVVTDATQLGDGFNIALASDSDTVVLEESFVIENAMQDYITLTYTDFGFDADTTIIGSEVLKGEAKAKLYNDAVEGYYSFARDASYVFFGGKWAGVGLHLNADGELEVCYATSKDNIKVLGTVTEEEVGMALDTPDLLIKTGIVFMNIRDNILNLKVTVRVNDSFEESYTISNVDMSTLVEQIFIHTEQGTTLRVKSTQKQKETVTRVALHSFDISNKTYNSTHGISVGGDYQKSLINTMTTMNIKLNASEGSYFNFAGKSGWEGLRFVVGADGSLELGCTSGGMTGEILTPKVAGTSLVGEEFKLSLELLESGKDVKIGVYINGRLYGNRYFVLKNGMTKLGTQMGIYLKNETDSVTLWSEPAIPIPVDFGEFGFTNNWAYELGLKKR